MLKSALLTMILGQGLLVDETLLQLVRQLRDVIGAGRADLIKMHGSKVPGRF